MKHPGIIVAAACLSLIAACGAHHPAARAHHPAGTATAVPAGHAAADCAKLQAAQLPLTAYDQLLIAEAARITRTGARGGAAADRTARDRVAAEISRSCPQFSYLSAEDSG